MKYLLLTLALLLFGCGPRTNPSSGALEALRTKANLYSELNGPGFLEARECDSLLFTSLATVGGHPANLTDARSESGQWFRRPSKDCYATGASKSTISRDMLLGLILASLVAGDRELLQELHDWGAAHDWIMGDGVLSRTWANPAFLHTLFSAMRAVGATPNSDPTIAVILPTNTGFAAHLDALSVLIQRHSTGETNWHRLVATKLHSQSPRNALFAYLAGFRAAAVQILLDETLFPSDRLPTSADRCEPYLWQRDPGPDWEPCDKGHTHSGADLIFLVGLLEKDI